MINAARTLQNLESKRAKNETPTESTDRPGREAEYLHLIDLVRVATANLRLLNEFAFFQVADDLVNGPFGEVRTASDLSECGFAVLEEVRKNQPVVAEKVPFLWHL